MQVLTKTMYTIEKPAKLAVNLLAFFAYDVLKGNTGRTLNFEGKTVLKETGFFASQKAPSLNCPVESLNLQKIQNFINSIKSKDLGTSSFIGYWIEKNQVYLDLSTHIENKNQAIQFGLNQEQLAIWDCKNLESIFLEKYKL